MQAGGFGFDSYGRDLVSVGAIASWGMTSGEAYWENFIDEDFESPQSDGTDNDITVNSKGIVTNVVVNDKPHRVFDESGKQLSLNDSKDLKKLDNIKKGDQLYNNISEATFFEMILKAGISHPLFRSLPMTALKSYYLADFGAKQIAPKFGIAFEETEYMGGNDKSFYRFQGQKLIYNLADAGNFTWGGWMHANYYTLGITLWAADRHSRAAADGPDTIEDQRAIKNGYNYLSSLLAKYKK